MHKQQQKKKETEKETVTETENKLCILIDWQGKATRPTATAAPAAATVAAATAAATTVAAALPSASASAPAKPCKRLLDKGRQLSASLLAFLYTFFCGFTTTAGSSLSDTVSGRYTARGKGLSACLHVFCNAR